MHPQSPEFVYICDRRPSIAGKLNGVRLGVKDLFQIANLPTVAGNPDWLRTHELPKVTSPSVRSLLEAGAILIGKTLTDELAYSLEGINQHFGTPTNPKAPQRLPGGSSSGSAVAVANNSIDLGLGTDTGGSIRVPASYNGLYGFRPSHGLISCQHLVPLAPCFDTVGWMTRDLETLTLAAEVLLPSQESSQLSHLVVGEVAEINNWRSRRQYLLDIWSKEFESVRFVELTRETLSSAGRAFRVLQGREIWQIHGDWIQQHQPSFAPAIGDRFKWCSTLTPEDERQAEQAARSWLELWQTDVLPNHSSVLLLPTTPGAAPLLKTPASELNAYRSDLMGLTAPAGLSRAPQLNLPYLQDWQAPWGVSLIGSYNCDRSLLDCAAKLDSIVSQHKLIE